MRKRYFFLFFALAFLILFLRRPDSLLYPQFWAEDGTVWFADAYNLGALKSLFLFHGGYLQIISRLSAVLSLFFPVASAPFVSGSIALLIQTVPALLIVSSRFQKIIPRFSVRIILAVSYLLLPNIAEIHANITGSQWFLALLAFMVLVADTPKAKPWKTFDTTTLLLSGLSGPFAIFLLPIASLLWLVRRARHHLRNLIIISGAAAIQLFGIFFLNHGDRIHIPSTQDALVGFMIFGKQVVCGALLGSTGCLLVLKIPTFHYLFFVGAIILAIIPVVYSAIKAPLELKLFLLFGGLVFLASLIAPSIDFSVAAPLMLLFWSADGIRYWLIPMLAFITTLVWCCGKTNLFGIRILSGVLFAMALIGVALDFNHPKPHDYQFGHYAQNLKELPAGQKITIPINPPGWSMELIKH